MSNIITPNIGAIGSFSVGTPYNSIVNQLKEYKVESIRSIQEMVDGGENPLQIIYLDFELTEDDMTTDIKNNVKIVVLIDSANSYAYIPENKFLSAPDATGIRYQEKALAINIGLTLVEDDLTLLMNDIKSLIQGRIGIMPNVQEINASAILRIATDTHNTIEQERKALITISPGYYYKYKECIESKQLLIEKNKRLSCFVTSTLSTVMSERAELNIYAINIESEINTFKYRLASNIVLDGSMGVEIRPNEYVIYDNNSLNRSIKIIRLDSNAVSIVKAIPEVSAIRHGLYVLNGKIVSIYLDATNVKYTVYDENLIELSNGDITGLITYDDFTLPIQIETNKLILGYKSSMQLNSLIMYLDSNNNLLINSVPIQGNDTGLIPNNKIFNVVKINNTMGIITYNGYYIKTIIDNDEHTIDTTPASTYIDSKATYIANITDSIATVCCDVSGELNITEIDVDHNRINAFKNSEFNYNVTNIIVTLDRSLLLLENIETDNSIKVKKYI